MKKFVTLCSSFLVMSTLSGDAKALPYYKPSASENVSSQWTTGQWTADDKAYIITRKQIYQMAKSGQGMPALYQIYKAKVGKKPYDYALVFTLACIASQAESQSASFARNGDNVYVFNCMANLPSNNSYEFTRMHFLMATPGYPSYKWKSVSLRLLKRDPQDYRVQLRCLQLLDPGQSRNDKPLGIYLVEQLKREDAAYQGIHAIESDFYMKCFFATRSQQDADAFISSTRKYTAPMATNDPDRIHSEQVIALVKGMIKVHPK